MSGKAQPGGAAQPLLHGAASSPPAYGTSSYYDHHRHHHYHGHHSHHHVAFAPHVHHVPIAIQPQPTVVIVRETRFRFCKAIMVAILIWFLVGALARSTYILHWGHGHGRPHWTIGPGSQSPDYPIPSNVDLNACEQPLKSGDSSGTAFEVSALSDTVLLFARGPGLYGTVQLTTTSERNDSVKFSVDLESRYHREEDTIVCSLKRKDGEQGVGIFNPSRERSYDTVRYAVVVEFPQDHPLIKRFESEVINSVYNIEDLQGKITFKELKLHGSNGGIHSKSLFAHWAELSTSNGLISGYFNASDSLSLHTSNDRIDVDVDFNQEKADQAVLSVTTSNAPLRARLSLHDLTSSKEKKSTDFSVTVKSSNSPLSVTFLDAPVDSKLDLRASTSNSPAEVSLHPTYEGHFTLHSSLFGAVVHEKPGVEDPSGQERTRRLRYGLVWEYRVEGDVTWGDEDGGEKGSVDVGSSNARITLNL